MVVVESSRLKERFLCPTLELLNGSVPAEGALRLVNFGIRVLLTVLVTSVRPMYLTTLGNDRHHLRVANERLSPAVRRGSLAVYSPSSDLTPQHVAVRQQ